MATPPLHLGGPSLSLLVLLPSSAHMQQYHTPIVPVTRPHPLLSRQSGSTIPSLKSIHSSSSGAERGGAPVQPIDGVVNAGRRLSLAPNIEAGTQTRLDSYSLSPSAFASSPISPKSTPSRASANQASETPEASTSTVPAFGSRRSTPGRAASGKRRPLTAVGAQDAGSLLGSHRASVQMPLGMTPGGGSTGRTRPGWEGDEIVGVLRGSGMEVTVIRHASHLPAILSPKHSTAPTYASFSQQTLTTARLSSPDVGLSHVILVPLCDSPSLPSLSILLAQGTTPTAVCFQQDLLERAKRTEDEWLPSALEQISLVSEMRERAARSSHKGSERPIVLAYSANPALAATTIAACLSAGASGVLKPPYDLSTAQLVKVMVQAARESGITSTVERPSSNLLPTPQSIYTNLREGERRVVLPPTALSSGAEHEAEKVLNAAVGSRKPSKSQSPVVSRSRESSIAALYPRKASLRTNHLFPHRPESPTSLLSGSDETFPEGDHHLSTVTGMYWYHPSYTNRRRSVDVAGLAVALRRAERAFLKSQLRKAPRGVLTANVKQGYMFPGTPPSSAALTNDSGYTDHPRSAQCEEDSKDTQLAELLSAMYYQSQLAIDVRMSDYAALSAPLDSDQRHRLVAALSTWDFKPHHFDEGDLFRVAGIMFEGLLAMEGLRELNVSRDQMNRLLFAIRAIYHAPNPYHNYVHAIDVLQATYSFLIGIGVVPPWSYLRNLGPNSPAWEPPDELVMPVLGLGTRRARDVLRPQDILAVVIAAMGHDVGHPGLSNAFMKNAKTPLSQVYEDKSVLENMHCMLVVQLLRKHGFGFLFSTSPLERIPARAAIDTRGFRKVLYSSVLATDMSLHFAWMAELKKLNQTLSQEDEWDEGEDSTEADRIMICQALIKCADISNPTRPIDVSEHWSSVLLKEWAVQASLEQDLHLPVSVIGSADAALQAKGQIGFIDLFTQPLFEAVSDVLPELQCYADSCASNRQLWQSRLDHFMDEAAADRSSTLIQPSVDGAAQDGRFRTLFPLLLPSPLVDSAALEPGPAIIPTTTPSSVHTPTHTHPHTNTNTNVHPNQHGHTHTCSPASKAMRAVYHANLLDQRARLSSWSTRVRIPGVSPTEGLFEVRRSSTPQGV